MKVEKLEPALLLELQETLQNYIQAWHKIPKDLDVQNLKVSRIRYVKDWGTRTAPEDGFILEFKTESDRHRELLGRSELGLSTEQFKVVLEEQNMNGLAFGKDFVTHTEWYEHPVIWGELDEMFDEVHYYEQGGKYESADYLTFNKKYD